MASNSSRVSPGRPRKLFGRYSYRLTTYVSRRGLRLLLFGLQGGSQGYGGSGHFGLISSTSRLQ